MSMPEVSHKPFEFSPEILCNQNLQKLPYQHGRWTFSQSFYVGKIATVYVADESLEDRKLCLVKVPNFARRRNSSRREEGINLYLLEKPVCKHIVLLHAIIAGPTADHNNLVFKYEGQDLAELYLNKGAPHISPEDLRRINNQALKALAFLKTHQVIHLDIKPENMIYYNGILKLIDFGLSRFHGDKARQAKSGTLFYRPLEAYFCPDRLDHSYDLFSLGATLAHLRLCVIHEIPFAKQCLQKDTPECQFLHVMELMKQTSMPIDEEILSGMEQEKVYVTLNDGQVEVTPYDGDYEHLPPLEERMEKAGIARNDTQAEIETWNKYLTPMVQPRGFRCTLEEAIEKAPPELPPKAPKRKALGNITNQKPESPKESPEKKPKAILSSVSLENRSFTV